MKAGTVEHIKFKRLKRTLNLRDWECVGILESLWQFTARSHMRGDIGASENLDIALALDWEGDDEELINAFVKSGWVDECEEHRLIIHDWESHCPNYVKGNLAKHGNTFAKQVTKQVAKDTAKDVAKHGAKDTAKHGAEHGATKPSQAKPSPTKPIQSYSDQVSLLPAEAVRIADVIIDHVRSVTSNPKKLNGADYDKTRYNWALEIDRANRIDGRSWKDLDSVLNFAINDDFWAKNILSGGKFRDQYDQLEVKAMRKSTKAKKMSEMTYQEQQEHLDKIQANIMGARK